MYKLSYPTETQIFYNNREENSGQDYLVNLILGGREYLFDEKSFSGDLLLDNGLERTISEEEIL